MPVKMTYTIVDGAEQYGTVGCGVTQYALGGQLAEQRTHTALRQHSVDAGIRT